MKNFYKGMKLRKIDEENMIELNGNEDLTKSELIHLFETGQESLYFKNWKLHYTIVESGNVYQLCTNQHGEPVYLINGKLQHNSLTNEFYDFIDLIESDGELQYISEEYATAIIDQLKMDYTKNQTLKVLNAIYYLNN